MNLLLVNRYVMKLLKISWNKLINKHQHPSLKLINYINCLKNISLIRELSNMFSRGRSISLIGKIIPNNLDGKYSIYKFTVFLMLGMKNLYFWGVRNLGIVELDSTNLLSQLRIIIVLFHFQKLNKSSKKERRDW